MKPRESREEKEARWKRQRAEAWVALKAALASGHSEGSPCSRVPDEQPGSKDAPEKAMWTRGKLVFHMNLGRGEPHVSSYEYTCRLCGAVVVA